MERESDYNYISPKYIVMLIPEIEKELWKLFDAAKYKNVLRYIRRWHEYDQNWENFSIVFNSNNDIDLAETLHNMPNDILIKVAIDLGIDTPGFLPSISEFRNILKEKNENAFQSFDRALKNVSENPDEAISLANSALEGIVKSILSSGYFKNFIYNPKDTLYDLVQAILKQFKLYPVKEPELEEINNIASSLLKASKNIEDLRSTKTKTHGKSEEEYIISDSLWANFIVNSVATIGLFLVQYFNQKYNYSAKENTEIDIEEIPF